MVSRAFKVLSLFLALVLSAMTQLSYADWSVGINVGGPGYWHDRPGYYYGWHDHPHWGWHYHHLPPGYFTLWVGGTRYYYYDGLYYQYVGEGDFVLVNPPMGAVVGSIPPDFQPVVVNGRTFYTSNGIYYVYTPYGYKVVHPPAVYSPPPMVVAPAPAAPAGSFPVNIPNSNGTYTTVVVTRSGSGYVGPQGEYYASFPSVAQLRAMYGK